MIMVSYYNMKGWFSMFRIYLLNTGEIWEWDSVPMNLSRKVKQAIEDLKWWRDNYPKIFDDPEMITLHLVNDGRLTGIIHVTDYFTSYSRVNPDDSFSTCVVYRKEGVK